jgi:hypothetical protein
MPVFICNFLPVLPETTVIAIASCHQLSSCRALPLESYGLIQRKTVAIARSETL